MTSTPALEQRPVTDEGYEALDDQVVYELVDGQLVERNVSYISSAIAMVIGSVLRTFIDRNDLGTVFGTDLGVRINPRNVRHTRKADVGFISQARAPRGDTGYLRVAPELVVEVISPGDVSQEVRAKVDEWLAHGVLIVWVAFPQAREIHVYAAGQHPEILTADDTITAGSVLPGFSAAVAELFPERLVLPAQASA